MTTTEIKELETQAMALPMGPERWELDFQLRDEKAKCSDYRHHDQTMTFREWMNALKEASKVTVAVNWDEPTRASYYEGQPESWVEYYDSGYDPESAAAEDATYWDA